MKKSIAISIVFVVAAALAGAARAGTITGKALFEGAAPSRPSLTINKDKDICGKQTLLNEALVVSPSKGIQNTVVFLTDVKADKAYTPAKPPSIDQYGCVYVPHVTMVAAGKPFDILNSDGLLHNVHSHSKANSTFNQAMPKFRKKLSQTLTKAEIVGLTCDVHDWMAGWIVVADHPYYALTSADGGYTLDNVPAGTYTLKFWHEKLGEQIQKVTVPATGSVTANVTFKARNQS